MLQVFKSQLGHSMSSVRQFLQMPIKLDQSHFAPGGSKSSARAQACNENRKRVRHMKRDLYDLLGQHPSSRQLMRRLAAVERTLHTGGLEGFEALPVRVIAKALAELDSLVRDWSSTGLAELRSRMAMIVKTRPHDETAELDALAPTTLPAVSVHGDLASALPADVSEVDHAEFEYLERSWVGFVPTERNAPPAATA
jgi:hypothetical protein